MLPNKATMQSSETFIIYFSKRSNSIDRMVVHMCMSKVESYESIPKRNPWVHFKIAGKTQEKEKILYAFLGNALFLLTTKWQKRIANG